MSLPPDSPPSAPPLYCEQSVCLKAPASATAPDLIGTCVLPDPVEGAPPLGLVTVHGWGGTRIGPHRILVRITRQAAQQGIPALRFDLPGRGESGGEADHAGLDDMIAATTRACNWLQDQHGCRRIALCGICSGGNVALGHASLCKTAGVALLSTLPFTERDTAPQTTSRGPRLLEYLRKALHPGTWLRLVRGEINVKAVGKTLARGGDDQEQKECKMSSRDILKDLAIAPPPLLFLYGSADPDRVRSWAYYQPFVETHKVRHAIHVVDGANHNYYTTDWSREVESKTLAFLKDLQTGYAD